MQDNHCLCNAMTASPSQLPKDKNFASPAPGSSSRGVPPTAQHTALCCASWPACTNPAHTQATVLSGALIG